MKIERKHWKQAYNISRKVHSGKMRLTEGRDALERFGINPNSAIDFINNLRHLLEGTYYTRTISSAATDDFLKWIRQDYGDASYANAIAAVQLHISYYIKINGAPLRSLRRVLAKHEILLQVEFGPFESPEEISASTSHTEGKVRQVLVNIYERNRDARTKCIGHYGTACSACSFDFGKIYGKIGKGFIHVHHLEEISSIGEEYKINPIEDLLPVCPNCHAMLHTSKPALTIEALRKLLDAATGK